VEICVYLGARRPDCAGISANFFKGSPPAVGDRARDRSLEGIGRDLAPLGDWT
jgi:hypothetical protein